MQKRIIQSQEELDALRRIENDEEVYNGKQIV